MCCRGGLSPSRGPGRALNAHRHHNALLLALAGLQDAALMLGHLDSAMVDYTIHRNENLAWQ
jgi:hypothetical protein